MSNSREDFTRKFARLASNILIAGLVSSIVACASHVPPLSQSVSDPTPRAVAPGEIEVFAVGDIASCYDSDPGPAARAKRVAELIERLRSRRNESVILALGDMAYYSGGIVEY